MTPRLGAGQLRERPVGSASGRSGVRPPPPSVPVPSKRRPSHRDRSVLGALLPPSTDWSHLSLGNSSLHRPPEPSSSSAFGVHVLPQIVRHSPTVRPWRWSASLCRSWRPRRPSTGPGTAASSPRTPPPLGATLKPLAVLQRGPADRPHRDIDRLSLLTTIGARRLGGTESARWWRDRAPCRFIAEVPHPADCEPPGLRFALASASGMPPPTGAPLGLRLLGIWMVTVPVDARLPAFWEPMIPLGIGHQELC